MSRGPEHSEIAARCRWSGWRLLALLLIAFPLSAAAATVDPEVSKELAPTGKLRVGVAYAPSPTPLFVAKTASGEMRGVPRDLGIALAQALDVPVDIVVEPTTGKLTEACAAGTIDVGIMPIDDERRKQVDFSPPYFFIESTFLVAGSTGINTLGEVDRPDVTVVGIAGSATMRAASRSLTRAKVVAAPSVGDAMTMMKSGQAQAFALTHDALPGLQKELPGSRILDGAYLVAGVGLAVRKGHPAALSYVDAFVARAKRDGTIRHAFDAAGLQAQAVAP